MDIKRKNHPLNISAILDVLAPLAWVALVSLVALAGRAVGNDWMLFGGLWFALAVAAGLWASRQPWIENQWGQTRLILSYFHSVIGCGCT